MGNPKSLSYDSNNMAVIDLGSAIIRMEPDDPPQWALEIARKELRETPDVAQEAKKKLKELIEAETELNLPTDDFYLQMFLRPTHYYPESALKRIKHFYNMLQKYGEACRDIVPAKVQHVFEAELLTLLPNRDQHGRRILVLQAGKKWKPSEVSLVDMFRGIQLTVLGSMVEPLSQICGAVVIIDVEGLPMGHIMHFTPNFAAMLLDYVQECICVRLKAVHIVNNSYIFNILFNIFKPFIREKLRKRIYFHGKDMKSLTKHIDAAVLPAKYGGSATWEMPPGKLLGEFFMSYTPDFEKAASYGWKDGYKIKK
ncbi:alpha-tocopherol transfer protein-like [Musca vetustissima]|uniref:alpha-tocopherol transfer protein-like n=1 Tax=Musca vetustissima TaxID=27455 RepID=UPI002AB6FEC0|nr:alpha-tocopherol transfer protein-like [Musca vetustissima]